MNVSDIKLAGDVGGVEWSIPVLSFKGCDAAAPSIYLQAALHADELPGTAVCACARSVDENCWL